ncbi:MAG: hypothetical protein IPM68_16810 [Flavobacteriales bacterium]|nr:hypothetical protein [Flavobacteriales bacterium]
MVLMVVRGHQGAPCVPGAVHAQVRWTAEVVVEVGQFAVALHGQEILAHTAVGAVHIDHHGAARVAVQVVGGDAQHETASLVAPQVHPADQFLVAALPVRGVPHQCAGAVQQSAGVPVGERLVADPHDGAEGRPVAVTLVKQVARAQAEEDDRGLIRQVVDPGLELQAR